MKKGIILCLLMTAAVVVCLWSPAIIAADMTFVSPVSPLPPMPIETATPLLPVPTETMTPEVPTAVLLSSFSCRWIANQGLTNY